MGDPTLTARCETDAGAQNLNVRLARIDAPEKAQPFGNRSRQHLAELCFKQPAVVWPRTTDRYGRMVAPGEARSGASLIGQGAVTVGAVKRSKVVVNHRPFDDPSGAYGAGLLSRCRTQRNRWRDRRV